MRNLKTRDWLLTLATAMGLATTAVAQENDVAQRADQIFSEGEQSLVKQIGHDCAPGSPLVDPLCSTTPCDGLGCDTSACESCYLFDGGGWSLQDLCSDCSPYRVGGWIQSGYHNRSTGLFNDRPGHYATHQAWLYAEKVADGSSGLDWGFRADFMYGIDANDTQAFGNTPGEWDYLNGWDHGSFGFAMPQLYGEVAYGDWSLKVGHFFTLLGYEVVTAPDNFFYSHAFTMYNSEAFTHTGALSTYKVNDNLSVYSGWTLGWDTGFDQYNDFGQHGSSWLGGYSFGLGDKATFTHIITVGDFGAIGDGYSQSVVLDVSLTDKLNYVFQSDFLTAESAVVNMAGNQIGLAGGNESYGINQYLLYSVNECVGVGGRFEWWKNNGNSIYAITGGVNYKPMPNLTLRPEIRYQWDPGTTNAGIASEGDAIFGMDAILTF
ncbi:outer membrane beta-barrel protein [Thalassoglobus sp.]|uniref:outer membrane beta-barrel protein n=1 Tax=Thalassoglobus sp. TaxID=2795869 RepID=UPI003AA88EB1